MKGLGKGKSC